MVNTFLVHQDFKIAVKILDNRRLGKQRVEARQLIDTIDKLKSGQADKKISWSNHPITLSWINHVDSLKLYFNCVVQEWINRGFNNNYELFELSDNIIHPYWIYNKKIHYSMMSQLVQKDSEYYSPDNLRDKIPNELYDYFLSLPSEYSSYGYIWPCKYTENELENLSISELAETYVNRQYCTGMYKNGNKCKNKALIGSFCKVHCKRDENNQIPKCKGSYKNGNPCKNNCKFDNGFCGLHGK